MKFSLDRISIVGLALAFWLIARPYQGIWHDSTFYTLQALHQLNPLVFSRDLFFLYGSQDQYSLFSHLHAGAISLWGLNRGTMVLQGLGLGLWFVAASALCRILPSKLAPIGLLLIASVDSHYGSDGLLSYGESFLTARLYAEAFSLAGLAAWLTGHKRSGVLAFAVAFAMHPLIALPALIIGLGMLFRPGVWFGMVLAGGAVTVGLGTVGVQPFTGLVQPMDALWWQLAVARSPFVFLHAWEWEGFSQALYVMVVTGTAWRTLPEGKFRRLAWVTLTCVASAFAIAYLGGSLLKLPLIAGLQLTRVMWIGLIITHLLLIFMLWESREGNIWNRLLAYGLVLGVFIDIGAQGVYASLVLAVIWLGRRHLPGFKPPAWLLLLLALVPLQIILWEILDMRMRSEWNAQFAEQAAWRTYFSSSATALVMVLGAYWLIGRERISKFAELSIGATVVGALGLAVVSWYDLLPKLDYDSPARQAAIAPIAAVVPERATVYWVGEPEKAWFWLGRANYLSFNQSAGSVFSRYTAVEGLRRSAYVRPASLRDSTQNWDERFKAVSSGLISESIVQQVCQDPILDFVIAVSQPGSGVAYFEDPATGRGYGLYDCRDLRKSNPTVSSTDAVVIQDRDKGHP